MGVPDKDRINRPGPGQYSKNNSVKGDSLSTRGAGAISTTQRVTEFEKSARKAKQVPGPGNYRQEINRSGPEVTFGAKQPTRYNKNPGPGQYENNSLSHRASFGATA